MAQTKYTGSNALTYIFTLIKQYVTNGLSGKVDKETSKGLSTNDYTTTDKNKLGAIEAGAQVNKLETVKVNGVALVASDKAVDITMPTKVSELTNDSGYQTAQNVADTVATKANASDLTAHTGNTDIHVTSSQKQAWDNKLDSEDLEGYATDVDLALKANAADVYTKSDIDGKGYQNASQVQALINDAVGDLTGVKFEVVDALPQTGEDGVIYLVAHAHDEGDGYDEYIWLSEQAKFEKIGNTDIDLSGYVLSSDLVELSNTDVQELWDSVMG